MLKRLLPLLALCALAQSQCPFTRPIVEGTNRIVMVRLRNRQLMLKRTASSAVGESLQLWCSPRDVRPVTCQRGQRPSFVPPLPMTCQRPPVTVTIPVTDRRCRASMFRVGYNIGRGQFLGALPKLLRQEGRANPLGGASGLCQAFLSDGVISGADEASYTVRNIHATFRRLFGNNQNFIPNNRDAASADFLFGDQMCATFKYVNVVPQFLTINDRNWEAIERWVRSSVRGNQFVNVRTGANGILTLPAASGQRQVFLSGNRNPVPLWMYKIVRDSNNRPIVAFLTYNNIYARQRPAAPAFCQVVNCPLQLGGTAADGFTFCCNPATFNP
ncbi:GL13695 [Drosophila persimilis]|uniref:GL13695 n=1 Tax=Drosophila persimilis TaxID=7234 RepID=B4GP09_DROPE|nr:GL13695 [Drosophila persimilis]